MEQTDILNHCLRLPPHTHDDIVKASGPEPINPDQSISSVYNKLSGEIPDHVAKFLAIMKNQGEQPSGDTDGSKLKQI